MNDNYAEDYITKATAQEVVKDVFRVDTITQEIIDTCIKCMEAIKYASSSDVRKNVKGEWIHDEITRNGNTVYTPNAKCSVCDCYVFQESNFCPNCGVNMKGK